MDQRDRPFRSMLYIPGAKQRALEKAAGLATDAIIFDLEDAVAPETKAEARNTLAAALRDIDYGPRAKIVRINALDTEWGPDDIAALAGLALDGVLLPKVNGATDIEVLAAAMPKAPLWAMMETPLGVLHAGEIAAHPRMAGFVMGTNDLAKELGSTGRGALTTALQTCLLAARAEGRVAVDGVFNAFRDADGLRGECIEGRDLGFDGKTLIHPDQLAIANEIFAPDAAAIDLARRRIDAFEAAQAAGEGVAVVDGAIVENLHVETARRTLARAEMIEKLKGDA